VSLLHRVSVWALILSGISFVVIVFDLFGRPQKMTIMNCVWPITALYFGPFALWTYFGFGRQKKAAHRERSQGASRAKSILAEGLDWRYSLRSRLHAWRHPCRMDRLLGWNYTSQLPAGGQLSWDFVAAYLLGVIFQYFSIAPMRNLSGWPGIKAALKADTISLTAFEIGLFAFMFWKSQHFHPRLEPTKPEYWFLMQVGMIIGFFTSYPANWWLIRKGWKEAM
jgi:Domain of unknown function (DUF4396)